MKKCPRQTLTRNIVLGHQIRLHRHAVASRSPCELGRPIRVSKNQSRCLREDANILLSLAIDAKRVVAIFLFGPIRRAGEYFPVKMCPIRIPCFVPVRINRRRIGRHFLVTEPKPGITYVADQIPHFQGLGLPLEHIDRHIDGPPWLPAIPLQSRWNVWNRLTDPTQVGIRAVQFCFLMPDLDKQAQSVADDPVVSINHVIYMV